MQKEFDTENGFKIGACIEKEGGTDQENVFYFQGGELSKTTFTKTDEGFGIMFHGEHELEAFFDLVKQVEIWRDEEFERQIYVS